MYKRTLLKNHHREIQLISRRTGLALLIIGLLLLFLISRLVYLQIIKNELYTTLSTQNAIDLIPDEPTRGLIFDRKGTLIAENIPVFSLDIIPNQVANLSKTLNDLKKIIVLNDSDLQQFYKQLKQHRRFEEIPLKLRLNEKEVAQFSEHQYRFPGVIVKGRLMRHYPYGESFAHVLGYVGRINAKELSEIDVINYSASHYIGKLGIEKYYEDELHGKVGYEEVETDASGQSIRSLKKTKGKPGSNLYLTIDTDLQLAAEKALLGHRGTIVAIEPNTGQVLAIVSQPSFDPNSFVVGISQHDYQELQLSEGKPLFDRALRGLYPLGSTIKPYIALQALQSGMTTPDFAISDNGLFTLPNSQHVFHDMKKQGHGRVNLAKAIAASCNIYFYQLALKMGIQQIDDVLTEFGFGQVTGIDLDGELPGTVSSPAWKKKTRGTRWYLGDTIISAIGQGDMQATPLQLAQAVATLSTRGKRVLPYLLLREEQPNQPTVIHDPIELDPIKLDDDLYWDTVIKAMQDVVTSPLGTAYRYFRDSRGYALAAKSGTAAVVKRRIPNEEDKQENMPLKLRDHHIFVVFAPIENPQIALALITENSNNAINAARIILDYFFGSQKNANRYAENKT